MKTNLYNLIHRSEECFLWGEKYSKQNPIITICSIFSCSLVVGESGEGKAESETKTGIM